MGRRDGTPQTRWLPHPAKPTDSERAAYDYEMELVLKRQGDLEQCLREIIGRSTEPAIRSLAAGALGQK